MLYQILFSRQMKRCVIITYKHGINELRHELPNNLRRWAGLSVHTGKKGLTILGN